MVSTCLLAIGVSGVGAFGFGMGFGKTFVSGDAPGLGMTHTAEQCADYLEYYPDSSSCEEAAAYHHFDETLAYRLAAGVLGLLTLTGTFLMRRWFPGYLEEQILHPSFRPTIGASLFGLVAVVFLGLSLSGVVFRGGGGWGTGPVSC